MASFISYSLSSTALIHSPAMRLQLQRRTLSLSLSFSFSRSLPWAHFCCSSLCAASCFLLLLPLLWLIAFLMHCVCEKQHTHTHRQPHNTHAQQKKMQRILNVIWESTRRPNFTHTHTHEARVQVYVCVCVIQVTVFMLSLFIHIFNANNNNWLSC